MYKLMTVILLLCFSLLSKANDKPILNVVSELRAGTTNSDGTGTYWDIVNAVYGENYRLNFQTMNWTEAVQQVKSGEADVLVGTSENRSESLIMSEQHIDIEYPLHIVYEPTIFTPDRLNDLEGKLIAGQKGNALRRYLPQSANFFSVDSISNISRLILNQRLDGALVYSYNLWLADPDLKLSNKVLIPEQPLYLAFSPSEKGEKIKYEFEENMALLIQTKKLSTLYSSKIEFQHADLTKQMHKINVDWNLIPKIFDDKTKKLNVIPWELDISRYIASQITGIKLNFKVNSYNETKKNLLENNNSCTINLRKSKTIENKVAYSEPIYAFIKPRIFVLKGTSLEYELNNLLVNDQLEIKELLDQHLNIKIIVKEKIHQKLSEMLSDKYSNRILAINEKDNYKQFIQLLIKGRVDALIMWPSIVADIDGPNTANKLVSFTLKESLSDTLFTYIGCHNDKIGIETINQINALLDNKIHQGNIYSKMIKMMDVNSANEVLKTLKNVSRNAH
jgi:polar amino acid transport system substrate-binding protein